MLTLALVVRRFLQVRTLGETVRLDSRTKLLNPKWYEGMLSSGYEGVREIQKRLTNTMGWSATSGAVGGGGVVPIGHRMGCGGSTSSQGPALLDSCGVHLFCP